MSSKPPTVSIIMRSKDADWVIHQALASLFSQHYDDFELIVIDSGSTDRTLEYVKQYPCRLREIPAEDYYPGPVLNMGAEMARGEILVFQNSDVVLLEPDSLGKLLAAFDDPEVDAAFARQLPRPEAATWVRRDYANSFPASGEAPPWLPYSLPLAAMRRSAWEAHNFYRTAWGSEDTEWGAWARRAGRTVQYVADSLVMHSHNYTLRQLYGRNFIEGEADAFIYERSTSLVRGLARAFRATLRDWVWQLREGDLAELHLTPARRLVGEWAYYKGHRHGEARRNEGNQDASFGQRAVLSRYQA